MSEATTHALRTARKAAGVCVRCGSERDRPEVLRCKECRKAAMVSLVKHRYNADYFALLAAQGGVCAVCGEHRLRNGQEYMHIDHDHTTGRVRGLVCADCNSMLGYARDSIDVLTRAIDYLKEGR